MVQSQLVLVELRENSADVQVGVGLDLGFLESRLDSERPLKEVQGRAHLSNTSVVASHVVESHGLAEFVVLTEFFGLFEQVEG